MRGRPRREPPRERPAARCARHSLDGGRIRRGAGPRPVAVLGLRLPVASVEDVIIAKLEWSSLGGGSRRQREDVVALLEQARDRLDLAYVECWVDALGLRDEWEALRRPG